jgi:hypothetical protein
MNNQGPSSPLSYDRALNEALVNADIASGYEEYLAIFERFYAQDVELLSDANPFSLRGKAHARAVIFNFLAPLHVMAEIAGLSVTLRYSAIASDKEEQHAEWTLDLLGITGRSVTLAWTSARRWVGDKIVYERHYDQHQRGEPLTSIDLDFNPLSRAEAARPS